MCSAEGTYMTAEKTDGTTVTIYWWDKGDTEAGFWTTIFRSEGWEEKSQVRKSDALYSGDPAGFRMANDDAVLKRHGIVTETIEFHDGAPIAHG